MLHITMAPAQPADPATDPLGRDRVGYSEEMTPEQTYTANRGPWMVGPRAHQERFALLSFDGVVRLAIAVDTLTPLPDRQCALEGSVLGPGHEVHDAYLDQPSPPRGHRSPVAYFNPVAGPQLCRCGCAATVAAGDYYLPEHEQRVAPRATNQTEALLNFLM